MNIEQNSNLPINYGMNLPIGSLDAYIQRVNSFPLLTAEKEYELAVRLNNGNDLDAARELVMAHLRYVVRIAKSYSGYGLAVADLIQEGNIGLMKAVKKFNPEKGARLVTFAVHWIKSEIHEFIIRNWKLVKVATTKAQRKLFFNLRSMKKRLGWFTQDEVNAVARDLGVKPEEVVEMEKRLSASDESFEPATDENDDDFAPAAYIASNDLDPSYHLEQEQNRQLDTSNLQAAFAKLNEREKDIISQRWFSDKKTTLTDLAAKYQISAERVRQLENGAMKKLRQEMTVA